MPTAASQTFSVAKLEPFMDADDADTLAVKLGASLTLAKGTILGEKTGTNEVQTLSEVSAATGGTFTVTLGAGAAVTAAFNVGAGVLQRLLETVTTIGQGNVSCEGGPIHTSPIRVTFQGALAATDIAALTISNTGLTGGTSPAVTVAETLKGVAGTVGVYEDYDPVATDGTQVPKLILVYDVTTDSAGLITLTATSGQVGGEFGQKMNSVPAYYCGVFATADLVGLNANALTALGARLLEGTVADGILAVGL